MPITFKAKPRVMQSNAQEVVATVVRRIPKQPDLKSKAQIIGPAMRDPKDGAYHYAYGTKYTHDDVIASLEDKFPDRAPFNDWTRGYVDVRLCFRIEP